MTDKIKSSYAQSKNIYDDVLTQDKWWSRLYIKLFWSGVDDNEIAGKVLSFIPESFSGELLDIPVGTAVFTCAKFRELKKANITCVDYSGDMLAQAEKRFQLSGTNNVKLMQGDVGNLPFEDNNFDIVLSMNGFHAFPDKEKAFSETWRVLNPKGMFIACFYIKGETKITDWLVNKILSPKGWFTPPFDTANSLKARLGKGYDIKEFQVDGSMVYFCAEKNE